MTSLINILLLSTLAGLGTGLGGFIVFVKQPGKRLLGFLMGFASGIMIMLSFLELMFEAINISSLTFAALGFMAGALTLFLLDFLLPHEHFSVKETGLVDAKLFKSGLLIAVGITLHNIPEGIAVASGYAYVPEVGLLIAAAVALHNIPEGIAIALPIYVGCGSKWRAFRLALISGLAEPLGALMAGAFLAGFPMLVPFGLAFAGGVMVFITLDELIPAAHEQGHEHFTSLGFIIGCLATFILLDIMW